MKNGLLIFVFLFGLINIAVTQTVEWVVTAGGSTYGDIVYDIAVDANGNTYITGVFEETAIFGDITLTALSDDDSDIFIAKLDAQGNFLWAKRAGAMYYDDRGQAIEVDADGNCYVTGYFWDTADFGDITLTSVGGEDTFVAKLNTDGDFIWAVNAGGQDSYYHYAKPQGIAIDGAGNTYITGFFNQEISFGDITLTTTSNQFDAFIAKLDAEGNFVWVKQSAGNQVENGRAIATDGLGNVYVSGYYRETCTFGNLTVEANGEWDIYIVKLDTNGNFAWLKTGGGNTTESIGGLDVDSQGNAYIVGHFEDAINFGSLNMTASGNSDVFIAKLNSSGDYLWCKQTQSTDDEYCYAVAVNNNGEAYLAGRFIGTTTFGSFTLEPAEVGAGSFFTKMDSDGNFLWVKKATADSFGPENGIAIDNQGNSYYSGTITGSYLFYDIEPVESTGNGKEIFVMKMTSEPVSVDNYDEVNQVSIYPNPANHLLNIQTTETIKAITIYNALGALVQTETRSSFSIEQLPAGIYNVHISTAKGESVEKLIVR